MFTLKVFTFVFLLVLPNFFILGDAQESRIAGGSFTRLGEYPSLASIRRYGIHYCGGSIVNSRWILTAAHCIFNQTQNTIEVVVGSNSLTSGGTRHQIKTIVLHELYRYETDVIADNDIGLLYLQKPIKLGPYAQKVKFTSKAVVPGTKGILVGWGRISQAAPGPSLMQKKLTVPITSNPLCDALSPGRTVVYSNFCSISPRGEGGCFGDSGTPLFDPWTGEQIGLYSWVVPPCGTGIPDGYTKVWEYLDWINMHVWVSNKFLETE